MTDTSKKTELDREVDRKLEQHLRREMDEMMFAKMDMSEEAKRKVRERAREGTAPAGGRRFVLPRTWLAGAAALAAAAAIVAGVPALLQPDAPAPAESPIAGAPAAPGDAAGSQLSELKTTTLGSIEEARAAFGPELRAPSGAPQGYALTETVAVAQGDTVRDVIFTYASGDKTVTLSASRMPASFPADLFTKVDVGGAEGFVFEQPELVELFWTKDGVHYSIVGALTAEEALAFAASIE